jgi:hypothetical protein
VESGTIGIARRLLLLSSSILAVAAVESFAEYNFLMHAVTGWMLCEATFYSPSRVELLSEIHHVCELKSNEFLRNHRIFWILEHGRKAILLDKI